MDNFKIMYRILRHLEMSLDCVFTDVEAISPGRLGVTRERWEQLLIMLFDEGYIIGIICDQTMSDDKRHIVEPIKPVITIKGLAFLAENSTIQKAAKLLKSAKETIPGI